MIVLLRLGGVSLLALVFSALFVPTTYHEIKIGFLLAALTSIGILGLSSKLIWSSETLMACFMLAIFGLLNSVHGLLNSAPGAVRVLSVMVVWPILYAVLSTMLNRPDAIKILVSTLAVTFVAIQSYSFLYLGYMAGVVPDVLYFELDQGQGVGFYDGTVEYSLYSISSLLFLMPFWLHYLFNLVHEKRAKISHWVLLLTGLVICVLTGRRAVQLVVLISPFLVLLSVVMVGGGIQKGYRVVGSLFNVYSMALVSISVVILLFVFFSMGIHFDAIAENFKHGFEFTSDISASERGNQFVSLMNAWLDGNLLFGAGNGSHTDYLRSDDMPWAYELTYVYLLFSTGIVGVLFYFGWFGWGLLRIRNALLYRPDMGFYITPIITGVFGLAVGAASNPYFAKFDYLWIVLLPHLLAGAIKYQGNSVVKYV